MTSPLIAAPYLIALLEQLIDYIPVTPDANCSCHLSSPCHDCTNHAYDRSMLIQTREAVKEIKAMQIVDAAMAKARGHS